MLHFNMLRKIKVCHLLGKTKGIKLKVLQNLKHLKNEQSLKQHCLPYQKI